MSAKPLVAILSLFSLVALVSGAVVSTGQYNNFRTGATLSEISLYPDNVNVNTFGKIGSFSVDGDVFAQPLYLAQKRIGGKSVNALFVATMHNTIYAFNADQPGSAPLWQQTLAPPVPAADAGACPASWSTRSELGILSTPVIDTQTGILYATYATPNGTGKYQYYIAALHVATGKQASGSPGVISASVPGKGYDAVNGTISLNETTSMQRPALTLANGNVYVAFASCGPDPDPYHGWVLAYNARDVQVQTSVFNSTPNGSRGGIWQSGRGLVADGSGYLYAATGNGTNSFTDVSDSVLKLGPLGLMADFFTPPDFAALSTYDLDLSSAGPLYIGSRGLLLAGGKEGVVYVMDPNSLGKHGSPLQTLQASIPCGTFTMAGCHEIHSLAFWDSASNPLLYVWPTNDQLRAYRMNGNSFNPTPDSIGSLTLGGGNLALSANHGAASSGILWALATDGLLHAYKATNVSQELYNSYQNPARDTLGSWTRYCSPTIADGKVFIATTDGRVQVYGLLGK